MQIVLESKYVSISTSRQRTFHPRGSSCIMVAKQGSLIRSLALKLTGIHFKKRWRVRELNYWVLLLVTKYPAFNF